MIRFPESIAVVFLLRRELFALLGRGQAATVGRLLAYTLRNDARRLLRRGRPAPVPRAVPPCPPPLISIIMPVYNTDPVWLLRAVFSVYRQRYQAWELCLADDASCSPATVATLTALGDPRVKQVRLTARLGIAGASNAAAALGSGDWLALLDHDDELHPEALASAAAAIPASGADLLYSDEDLLSTTGGHYRPHYKPDFSPDLLLSYNYLCHLVVMRRDLFTAAGGFRTGYDGAQDYDLLLRATEHARRSEHLPQVLYHWRALPESTAARNDAKDYALAAGQRALQDALARRHIAGEVTASDRSINYRVRRHVPGNPRVSILIPFRDRPDLLRRCLDSLLATTAYPNYEIIGIDNGSRQPETTASLDYYRTFHSRVRFIRDDSPFNYARLNNLAAEQASGEYLVLLNNDTEIIDPEWLTCLLEHAQRPEVGAVGGKLLYPDGTIQHAGVIIGIDGVAGHPHRGLPTDAPGYFFRANLIQNLSAVTAACLAVRRSVYRELGGLNETDFSVAYNDVDFCLRLRERGYLIVYTPWCVVRHDESASRGTDRDPDSRARVLREGAALRARHPRYFTAGDPYYNPHLSRAPGQAFAPLRAAIIPQAQTPPPGPKAQFIAAAQRALRDFLAHDGRLTFTSAPQPDLSIIIVVHNRAEFTLGCLLALQGQAGITCDIIVVDNASSDATPELLRRITGITAIRNAENRHFLRGVNQGAAAARGEFLLFLNNDTSMHAGALAAALATLRADPAIGAVGGKLILPDGKLQEAGSIIWRDGTCLGYGRGDNPGAAPYQFRREVDYCSAAFLLTPRALFRELGGFDEAFAPAYYEEVDYCLRLRARGKRIVYEPAAVVTHYEFGSSAGMAEALAMQSARRTLLVDRHQALLAGQLPPAPENVLTARTRGRHIRVLLIDEMLPHPYLGAGYPRAAQLLAALRAAECCVTHYPLIVEPEETWQSVYADLPREVEVMAFGPYGGKGLGAFLASRRGYYDLAIVSRPTVMRVLQPLRGNNPHLFGHARLVYDAEALFALRHALAARTRGNPLPSARENELLAEEIGLADGAASVLTVTNREAEHFRARGCAVRVLGHAIAVTPTPRPFAGRSGFLFAGALHGDASPNADAVLWFAAKVLPLLRGENMPPGAGNPAMPFTVAGLNRSPAVQRLTGNGITVTGRVPDLMPWYDASRVFVAPLRFAAGLPLKVVEAAAHGIPVVCTPLLAEQLGWQDGRDLLTAATPEEFADQCRRLHADAALWQTLRQNALARVGSEYSEQHFRTTVGKLLDGLPVSGV